MGEYTRIKSPYDGGTYTNSGMVDLIRTYCAVRGYPSLKSIAVMQGSFNTTVPASAGTHNLADCVDLSEYDWKVKDRIFRSIGGAIFHRTRAQGFAPHCHMVRMYSTAMAWLATAQDKAYRASAANGLGNLSHKDAEWMPRYRGVRHLSGPEEGKQFIATKATPGYSQAGSDPKNDKDLIKHNRAKGYVISGVAGRVRCQGKDYFIVSAGKDDMTFYLVADFNAYVPGWVAKTEKWVMAPAPSSATIYGRTAPGPDAPKKAGSVYPEATGHKLTSIGYAPIKGVKYVSTKNGTWFTATSLKPDAASTPPKPPATKPLRVGTLNFPDKTKITTATEAARIKRAVAQINAADLDILAIQEGVGRAGPDTTSSLMSRLLTALGGDWTAIVPTLDLNENYFLRRKGTTNYKQHPDAVIRGDLGGKQISGRHVTLVTFTTSIGTVTVGNTQLVNDNRPGAEVQASEAADALVSVAASKYVLLGDFNTSSNLPDLTRQGLLNARTEAKTSSTRDAVTYTNQDKTKPSTNPDWLIDQIRVHGLTVNGYTVVLDLDAKGNFVQPRVGDHSLIIVSLS